MISWLMIKGYGQHCMGAQSAAPPIQDLTGEEASLLNKPTFIIFICAIVKSYLLSWIGQMVDIMFAS